MERFWSKVSKSEGCWIWTAYTSKNGYGRFWLGGKQLWAHRVSWSLLRGEIPEELCIDHLCRNRRCVNPDHMELVTLGENSRRGLALRPPLPLGSTREWKCGHEQTAENIMRRSQRARSWRTCRICRTAQKRAHRQRMANARLHLG